MRDPSDRLIAGSIGYRQGAWLSADSIFYEAHPLEGGKFKSHIALAKVATVALIGRLKRLGHNSSNVGMLTPVTELLRARYIPRDEHESLAATLNAVALPANAFDEISADDFAVFNLPREG